MTKTGLEFLISVIIICLDFVIFYLAFLLTITLCYSKTAHSLYRQSHLTLT